MSLSASDGDDPIREIARVQIPGELIRDADLNALLPRIGRCFEQLQRQRDKRAAHDNAGFFGKLGNWITGNTGRSKSDLIESVDVQTELVRAQMVISTLNVAFAKRIAEQQQTIGEQQRRLEAQNNEIRTNQTELQRQNEKISLQQETILKLVQLTDEHEARIRETVRLATDIVDLEARLRVEAERQVARAEAALAVEITGMRAAVASQTTAIREHVESVRSECTGELAQTREHLRRGLDDAAEKARDAIAAEARVIHDKVQEARVAATREIVTMREEVRRDLAGVAESVESQRREASDAIARSSSELRNSIDVVGADVCRERSEREEGDGRLDASLGVLRRRIPLLAVVAWGALVLAVAGAVLAVVAR